MSLQRQLLVILFCFLATFFWFRSGFLTIQHFLIIPSSHPLLAQAKGANDISAEASNVPSMISISTAKISLPVKIASLQNGEWELNTEGVSLLTNNPIDPTETGLILYGHNWPVLLGRLHTAKLGDNIQVSYGDGRTENYTIDSMFTVDPSQLDVLKMAKPDTLLIYTCTGFMDSKRLVVLANKE